MDGAMKFSSNILATNKPAICDFKDQAMTLLPGGVSLIDLTQAVPDYGPPPKVVEALAQKVKEHDTAFYTEDEGLPALRSALAGYMGKSYGTSIEKEEILITAGGNQAFLTAMMTILDPGDEVILPTPFYFNHEMAVRMLGGVPVEVLLSPESGFKLQARRLLDALSSKTRAIVIVTPNNPTGVPCGGEEIKLLHSECRKKGIFLISDECYCEFHEKGRPFFSALQVAGTRDHLIHLGTFSKTLSLTGYRVGHLLACPDFQKEALKVQDTMVICAPRISQEAALAGLTLEWEWVGERRKEMEARLNQFRGIFGDRPLPLSIASSGAFFAFVRHGMNATALDAALTLAREKAVLTLPGSFFGRGLEEFLRFSVGTLVPSSMKELEKRLFGTSAGDMHE